MKFSRNENGDFIIPVDFNIGEKVFPLLQKLKGGQTCWYIGDETFVEEIHPEIFADNSGCVYYKLYDVKYSLQRECVWKTAEDADQYITIHGLNRPFSL